MKKIAATALVLLLLFSLSLTAFAASDLSDFADELISSAQDGAEAPSAVENDGEGIYPDDENEGHNGRKQYETSATEATGEATEPASEVPTESPTTKKRQRNTEPAAEAAAPEQGNNNDLIRIIVIISGALLLILVIILAVLLLRRNSSKVAGGSTVRVEVLSGLCYNVDFEFNFRRGLTIGTGKNCDLVFDDPRMLPLHAVISRAPGGVMTLSECENTRNTYIGGMKIFAPNRLRSGDIITIGMTSFRVFFDA